LTLTRPAVRLLCARTKDIARAGRGLVAPEDRRRLADFRGTERRAQFVAGRTLARHALARAAGRRARSLHILAPRGEKPVCAGGPPFSIAHSGRLVVCAVARRGAVGVDVEQLRAHRRTSTIAEHYFSTAEKAWIEAGPPERFYMLWVLKEAYLKALGTGLAGGLGALQCRIEPPRIELRAGGDDTELALFRTAGAFIGVATLGCPLASVEIEPWTTRSAHTHLRFVASTRVPLTRGARAPRSSLREVPEKRRLEIA
jgi:phosphopantetheinyl transferase